MRSRTHSKLGAALALTVVAVGTTTVTGCSHKTATAEITAPQQIKSAMGGHYSPSVQAQNEAFIQQQEKKREEMTLTMGKGYAHTGTAGQTAPAVGGNP